jgi:hypothetical protein
VSLRRFTYLYVRGTTRREVSRESLHRRRSSSQNWQMAVYPPVRPTVAASEGGRGGRGPLYDSRDHYREASVVTDRNLILAGCIAAAGPMCREQRQGSAIFTPEPEDRARRTGLGAGPHFLILRWGCHGLRQGGASGCTPHLHGRNPTSIHVSSCSVGDPLATDCALARSCDDERAE